STAPPFAARGVPLAAGPGTPLAQPPIEWLAHSAPSCKERSHAAEGSAEDQGAEARRRVGRRKVPQEGASSPRPNPCGNGPNLAAAAVRGVEPRLHGNAGEPACAEARG